MKWSFRKFNNSSDESILLYYTDILKAIKVCGFEKDKKRLDEDVNRILKVRETGKQ